MTQKVAADASFYRGLVGQPASRKNAWVNSPATGKRYWKQRAGRRACPSRDVAFRAIPGVRKPRLDFWVEAMTDASAPDARLSAADFSRH
jgi:hypothetical protein